MAKKKTQAPLAHSLLKCQIRLAAARNGVLVQVATAPGTPAFRGVKMWPADGDKERELELKGGHSAVSRFEVAPDEDFWLEISYGDGKRNSVQIYYERKRTFAYKAAQVKNPLKVDLNGSVPRIREQATRKRSSK